MAVKPQKLVVPGCFFEMLSQEGYTVHFRDQLNNKQVKQIINEVLQVRD